MKINHDIIRKNGLWKSFSLWVSQKNPLRYLWNRFQWHYYPRFSILREYPIHIDIELSSHCQLHCPMCFRFHRKIENQGHMAFETFKRIIDQASGKVFSIKFTGRGEPLLNPDFQKFIEYLGDKNFGEVAMITNGQLLKENLIYTLVRCKMDRVAFSIDGPKEEYERIRAPIKYEEIISIVSGLKRIREEEKSKWPLIRIQGVNRALENGREFLDVWEPISDEILFLEYKDYSPEAQHAPQASYPCPLLYQRMMIHWDGTVPMCINDEYEESRMGNIHEKSMWDIWHGGHFDEARRIHKKGERHMVYKNCAICALHRAGHGK